MGALITSHYLLLAYEDGLANGHSRKLTIGGQLRPINEKAYTPNKPPWIVINLYLQTIAVWLAMFFPDNKKTPRLN